MARVTPLDCTLFFPCIFLEIKKEDLSSEVILNLYSQWKCVVVKYLTEEAKTAVSVIDDDEAMDISIEAMNHLLCLSETDIFIYNRRIKRFLGQAIRTEDNPLKLNYHDAEVFISYCATKSLGVS